MEQHQPIFYHHQHLIHILLIQIQYYRQLLILIHLKQKNILNHLFLQSHQHLIRQQMQILLN